MEPHQIEITVEDKLANAEAEVAFLKNENRRLKQCLRNTPNVVMVENHNELNGVNLSILKWLEERAFLIG